MKPDRTGRENLQCENRQGAFEFVQCDLRLFGGLYVVWRYPAVLVAVLVASARHGSRRGVNRRNSRRREAATPS